MEKTVKRRLPEKIDRYLNQACHAESVGDYKRAEKLFWQALHREGQLRSDTTDPKQYADAVGPVYQETIERRLAKSQVKQITVPCTSRVRKQIVRNLDKTARSRVNKRSAQRYREILNELEKKDSLAYLQPQSNLVRKDGRIEATGPTLRVAENLSKTREIILSIFAKLKDIFANIRQRFCFSFGFNKIDQSVAS